MTIDPHIINSELHERLPYSPCRAACPVHIDVRAYVGLIAQGRYEEAFEIIRAMNPIASACSLICYHPCEQACRRSDVDEPLAIRHLKRFAMEQATEYRRKKRKPIPHTQKEKIAIIGSGPSGLTAANDLADLGYSVTIFEKYHDQLGGMLACAIPPYRLPRNVLKEDIDDILAKGVEAKTGCEIGKDLSFNDILSQYDAVLIAAGLSQSLSLPIPGVEGPGVVLALPFLENVAFGKKPRLGKQLLIIGGGNVAIDVARTARRIGHEDIQMVCLEHPEEMPAWKWEIDETIEEGIRITHQWGPLAIRRKESQIEGLEVVRVKSIFDEAGRFHPTFYSDQTSFISADTIIIAIGRRSELSFLKDTPVKSDERGHLAWNKETHQTSMEKVFASGEVITGPNPAIQAVANGRRAGRAIHLFLQGKDIQDLSDPYEEEGIGRFPKEVREKIKKQAREKIEVLSPKIRRSGFIQYEIGYDEISALKEARRCRSCGAGASVDQGRCCGCLTCFRVCPYGTPVVVHRARMLLERCQACGLCVSECPAEAISMMSYDVNELIREMPQLIGTVDPEREKPILVGFHCNYHAGIGRGMLPSNVRSINLHCASRIGVRELLRAFGCGADGVYVVLCHEADCKYRNISSRVKNRIERVREMLQEIGIDKERLVYVEAGEHPEAVWIKTAEEMTNKIKILKI